MSLAAEAAPSHEGSYGVVMLHPQNGQRFVIKQCKAVATDVATYGAPRHHLREVDALHLLQQCPHVLRASELVFDHRTSRYAFTMLRVAHGALNTWPIVTHVSPEIRIQDGILIVHSVVGALHNALRGVGLVHRDIKPANIFVAYADDPSAPISVQTVLTTTTSSSASSSATAATTTTTVLPPPPRPSPPQPQRVRKVWVGDWGSSTLVCRMSGSSVGAMSVPGATMDVAPPPSNASNASATITSSHASASSSSSSLPLPTPQALASTVCPVSGRPLERAWTGADMQTQWYRSPEAFVGVHPTTQIDVWSVGVVALYLFAPCIYATLRVPTQTNAQDTTQVLRCLALFRFMWPDENIPAIYCNHPSLKGHITPKSVRVLLLLSWPTTVPEAVRHFVRACLHVDPTRRASLSTLLRHPVFQHLTKQTWTVPTPLVWKAVPSIVTVPPTFRRATHLLQQSVRALWTIGLGGHSRLLTMDTALHLLHRWWRLYPTEPISIDPAATVLAVWCIAHKLHEHYHVPVMHLVQRFASIAQFDPLTTSSTNENLDKSKSNQTSLVQRVLDMETRLLCALVPPWSFTPLLPWLCRHDRQTAEMRNQPLSRLFGTSATSSFSQFARFVVGYILITSECCEVPIGASSADTKTETETETAAAAAASPEPASIPSTDALLRVLWHVAANPSVATSSQIEIMTAEEQNWLRTYFPSTWPKWLEHVPHAHALQCIYKELLVHCR